MTVRQWLEDRARELGFSMLGIVPATPSPRLEFYLRWIEQQRNGLMGYLARDDRIARRKDLTVIQPNAKSVICVGMDYHWQDLPAEYANDPSRGRISNYAWSNDYHDVMTPRLEQLASEMREELGGEVQSKVYVDTGAILERDHAELAGMGFVGKNTMLIGPRNGSWFFLGEIVTTASLPTQSTREKMPHCGSCQRCLTDCPTDAIVAPYELDARLCISYLTIELKGWIPQALRPQMGNWIYGCDVCQDVCPFNRFAPSQAETAFRISNWEVAAPKLKGLLRITPEEFKDRFLASPIARIRRHRLVRNSCVAAGNWGHLSTVDDLANCLIDEHPLVRGHAAWALGQVAQKQSTVTQREVCEILNRRRTCEDDGEVQSEISAAISGVAESSNDAGAPIDPS